MRRGLIWPVAIAAVAIVVALLAIHTPWARGRAYFGQYHLGIATNRHRLMSHERMTQNFAQSVPN